MTDAELDALEADAPNVKNAETVHRLAAEVRLLRRHVLMLALAIRQAHEATESAQVVAAALAPDLPKYIPER